MSKSKLEKILFIKDRHIQYHDKDDFNLMLKVDKIFKLYYIIIMGDFADFYGVSSHSKDPNRALKLKEEMDEVKKALDQVKALGAKNNVFVSGNHEDRLERYLRDKAPELFNIISIPKILELKEKGFKYTPYKQAYKIGKLNITHDTGVAGRFAHYKALDTFQHNIVIGHCHRLAYAVEGNAQGERHITAMFGWLGDVKEIDYMNQVKARKEWSLGFGIGYLEPKTGVVYLVPVPIINGTVLLEGKIVTL
jgi:UDP-2,3-diacylglucosamine pyrophosphatase LpxH